MTKLARVAALLAIAAIHPASAERDAFAESLTFEGVDFSRQGTGEMKARALFTTVTLCEFAKYEARDDTQQVRPRLLVLRFARKLSAGQLQQVFRGVLEGHPGGYSDSEREVFLGLLPAVVTDSLVQFRADTPGTLGVFADGKQLGSVAAPTWSPPSGRGSAPTTRVALGGARECGA